MVVFCSHIPVLQAQWVLNKHCLLTAVTSAVNDSDASIDPLAALQKVKASTGDEVLKPSARAWLWLYKRGVELEKIGEDGNLEHILTLSQVQDVSSV